MRAAIITIISVIFICITAFGTTYIPFDGVSNESGIDFTTTQANLQSAAISLQTEGVIVENIPLNGESFARLSWQNSGIKGEIGKPEIPFYRFYLEIPYNARVSIRTINEERLEYSLDEIGASNRIIPVQPPLEKMPGARNDFEFDTDIYSLSGFSNAPTATVEDYIIIRGRQIAVIAVRLLNYNPAESLVSIVRNLDLRCDFIGGDIGRTQNNLARYNSSQFNRFANKLVANPGIFQTDALPDPPGLLIICANNPNYLTAMQEFVDWKLSKGFHVTLVSTAVTGSTTGQIQSYILNAYNTWEVPPSFVLLVGETNEIPIWIGQGSGSPETDLYYAAIDGGDYFPDLGVSRFSPGNVGHLLNMINKTLSYEQVGWVGNDWWEKYAVFMASNDNWSVSEGTHNYIIQNYLQPAGYSFDRLYCHTFSATTQQVTNSFNDGRSQGTYSGHGSTTSWGDGPPFSQSDVYALTNDVYPLVQSYSCLTGTFTVGECFGETWIRHSSGALAFWGSSVTSYWGEDDILEKGVYEGIYDNQAPGDSVNFTWINGLTDYGKMKLYDHYGHSGTIQRYFEMYNVLGDGSVDIWTDVPNNVTVNHPAVVFLGSAQASVQVTGQPNWALICAHSTAEENVWASGYADASGTVTLDFSPAPTMPGEMIFTVTGHDIEPYIQSVPLIPAAGPYVVYNDVIIEDATSWIPNGQLDFGEQTYLSIFVENVGTVIAENVQVDISSDDPYITILDGSEAYGDIEAGLTVFVPLGFQIEVEQDVPDNYSISFDLTARAGADIWETFFTITAHAPVIAVETVEVDDPLGNNNNALDPGETADIHVTFKNNGSTTASNLGISFAVLDPGVEIPPDDYYIASLIPDGEGTVIIEGAQVNESLPQNTLVDFRADILADGGYDNQDFFELLVGDILNMPTGPDNYGYMAYDWWDAPMMPVYDWVEICADSGGLGTLIPFTSDDQVFQYQLPFSFTFYGADYDTFTVGANGWISMGRYNDDDYSNSGIPNNDGPPAMIAPYWEDLSPQRTNSGKVWRYYDASENRFIVEYNHVEQYSPSGFFETFQVILLDPAYYPTATGDGQILFQYKDMSDELQNDGTIGIENQNETDGVEYFFDGDYDQYAHVLGNGTVLLFTTQVTTPDLVMSMTPASTPIVIPSNGGSFEYTLEILNNSANPSVFDGWIDVDIPGGSNIELLLRPGITLGSGAALTRDMTQQVPAGAPAGDYEYWGHAGDHPNTIWAEDSFPFEKAGDGVDGMSQFTDWTLTGWEEQENANALLLPEQLSLSQNYPNPFNPSTSIDFTVPEAGNVSLIVYDVLGREVWRLIDGDLTPGFYTVKWNAEGQSAGIYFLRMQAEGFNEVRKLLLVK